MSIACRMFSKRGLISIGCILRTEFPFYNSIEVRIEKAYSVSGAEWTSVAFCTAAGAERGCGQ